MEEMFQKKKRDGRKVCAAQRLCDAALTCFAVESFLKDRFVFFLFTWKQCFFFKIAYNFVQTFGS